MEKNEDLNPCLYYNRIEIGQFESTAAALEVKEIKRVFTFYEYSKQVNTKLLGKCCIVLDMVTWLFQQRTMVVYLLIRTKRNCLQFVNNLRRDMWHNLK